MNDFFKVQAAWFFMGKAFVGGTMLTGVLAKYFPLTNGNPKADAIIYLVGIFVMYVTWKKAL